MPNRNLTADELAKANELLSTIRDRLEMLAGCDPALLFAYRPRSPRSSLTTKGENRRTDGS